MEKEKKQTAEELLNALNLLKAERENLREELTVLKQSNAVLKERLESLTVQNDIRTTDNLAKIKHLKEMVADAREKMAKFSNDYYELREEMVWLKGRNLWQRIINKGAK